ncbi:MAG TPA: hypothetical protein VJR27_04690 [Candidatus Saccharimonadales bacterium]|nr:hypothetical protein [Candidatus Saccharimonadales bacterium]
MDTQKQQIVDRLKQANNILVTVKSNPTVDHLAACIALTLALNKLGKHATAVFSGSVPSTIEFLQPEKTIEKNTDSLRDFIIALDKSKADKLRYKVEDKVVKIFITPYKTSINERDLEFSQGDFNVDVVIALGVHQQNDLDQAITSHGRILHDATVVSVNVEAGPNLGSINWTKPNASSLSELVVEVMDGLDKTLLDGQIATAALTGIVAETDRFSNNRTSPQTMSISAELMAVGANQQLVATKLAEPIAPPPPPMAERAPESAKEPPKPDDGTLEIEHDEQQKSQAPQIDIDENGGIHMEETPPSQPEEEQPFGGSTEPKSHEKVVAPPSEEKPKEKKSEAEEAGLPKAPEIPQLTHEHSGEAPHMVLQPPTLGGQLTAATSSDFFDPLVSGDVEQPSGQPILNREPLGASQPHSEEAGAEEKSKDSHEEGKTINPPDHNAEGTATPAEVPASNGPVLPEPTSVTEPTAPAEPVKPWQPPETPAINNVSSSQPTTEEGVSEATLSDIEKQLHSPHASENESPATPATDAALPASDVSNARDAVAQAVNTQASTQPQEPIAALNAQELDLGDLQQPANSPAPGGAVATPGNGPVVSPAIIPNAAPFAPDGLTLPGVTGATESAATPSVSQGGQSQDPNAPPPVPPPMLPPTPS